jgi:hypothetical protein
VLWPTSLVALLHRFARPPGRSGSILAVYPSLPARRTSICIEGVTSMSLSSVMAAAYRYSSGDSSIDVPSFALLPTIRISSSSSAKRNSHVEIRTSIVIGSNHLAGRMDFFGEADWRGWDVRSGELAISRSMSPWLYCLTSVDRSLPWRTPGMWRYRGLLSSARVNCWIEGTLLTMLDTIFNGLLSADDVAEFFLSCRCSPLRSARLISRLRYRIN